MWLIGGAVAAVALLAAAFYARYARKARHTGNPAEPNWSVPTIDRHAELKSFFHDWDPRIKIAVMMIYCFLVVSIENIGLCLAALLISVCVMWASRLPWRQTLTRLKAMSGFLLMFLIVLPLSVPQRPGDTLVVFGGLEQAAVNLSGLLVAVRVVAKACAVAMLMDPLFATATLSVTLNSLSAIGVPSVICQMVLLAHRYIFVFLHEIKRMYKGMLVRGFQGKTSVETMKIIGNFLGMLFVRSFDRTQRVYEAMLCRGYDGAFPTYHNFEARPVDWLKGAFFLAIGIGLLAVDIFVMRA